MSSEPDCDVLVVGAGPTGLMAACLLVRSGVRVRIIERRVEPTRESRAFAVQARTLELMRALGLADRFLARGVIAGSVNLHVGGRFHGGLNFDLAQAGDTPFPFILMIPQSETEALLIQDLAEQGVRVERGRELGGLMQDDDGVIAHIRALDGAETEIRSAFIIGADGSRSAVREATGITWDGEMLPQRFLLADCKVDWPLDHHRFRVFLNGRRIGLFLPLYGSQLSRVMATDLSGGFGDGEASQPLPLDLKEMQEGLSEAINMPVTLSDPVWITRYRAHHRFVDRYRRGRAFLAGDAAHIHSPAGGQGMNTGLQDAANLAWKLASVLRGGNPALLDTYDGERRPVGEKVVKSTGRLFAAAAGQAGFKAALRDLILPLALKIISRARPIQTKAFRRLSQRDIVYPAGTPAVSRDAVAWKAGPVPGARAPNAALRPGREVFDLLSGYRTVVLALSRKPLEAHQVEHLKLSLAGLVAGRPHVSLHLVARQAFGMGEGVEFTALPDIFDRYGVGRGDDQALYIIRPDGYVAWRSPSLNIQGAAAFLADVA
ncbi:FAD-dependent monooxygenase [Niveispirillum sp. KHB5.9]|uniref:FAD-dependent monooxygenase n=1 Tax=Niveispirillum sp. KHB5.9 TaxID=3400269 RepID=UPI003A84AE00